MKVTWLILFLVLGLAPATVPGRAAEPDDSPLLQPGEILDSLQDWMEENLDEHALDQLGVDKDRVRRFLAEVRKRFQGTYVYDLGALRETAANILPVLEQFEETRPYAVWLKTRLDYFDVAEELRRRAAASRNAVTPAPAPAPLPNPSPRLERTVWVRELRDRSVPPAAREYLPALKEIFAAEGLPTPLVWLAEVESSFNPEARSPAGAAGLFQLMPGTARSLQLAVGVRDERLQTGKSARAAARHLRRLYEHYRDWPLSLAAYNTGEARVDQLLKKSRARSFDAIADRLPAETRMYVPKVDATLRKREGVSLEDLGGPTPAGGGKG